MESIERTVPGCSTLFVCTEGDDDVLDAIDGLGCNKIVMPPAEVGDAAKKFNAGVRATIAPLLFTGACDLLFHGGWFEAAAKLIESHEDGAVVVGTNDLGSARVQSGDFATHVLVARSYIEKFGTIDTPGNFYHEGYLHELIDDEAVGTARSRGRFLMALDSHVEHMHPRWGKAPWDPMYAEMYERIAHDRVQYWTRRKMWRRK
jgi:hypothetical protein